ncbi:MAG: hypothetical protein EBU93_05340 [Chlamydiae bacterium]|nr:hypothetical protein [Chlamydiota bacterium]
MRSFIIRALILTLTLFNSNFIHGVNPSSYLVPRYKVGDYAQGGVIFFVTPDGNHGLVASIEDISSSVAWGDLAETIGATANYLGFGKNFITAGKENTTKIVDKYPNETYAANLCNNYSVSLNGMTYEDWYLPCLLELGLMMTMRETIESVSQAHGGDPFEDRPYWSSFEAFSSVACTHSFGDAGQYNEVKDDNFRVRAVRAF